MDTLKLEDLDIYQLAMASGEEVWSTVIKWEYFAKTTEGKQFVEASDSISANIAEGYSRYFYKDRKTFYYSQPGIAFGNKNWATKALKRSLIRQDEYYLLLKKLRIRQHKLNGYIKKLKMTSQ